MASRGNEGEGIRVVAVLLLLLMLGVMGILADARELRPSLTVHDQPIEGGTVQVAQAVSTGPGWVVIYGDSDGAPGEIIGHVPVGDGVNTNVDVPVDVSLVTERLYAILHQDSATVTAFEYPQADLPVRVNGLTVMDSFLVIEAGMAAQQFEVTPPTPSISVDDQPLVNATVVISEAVSSGPGWIVILTDADGELGVPIGYAAVVPGVNTDVVVAVDAEQVTQSLHAMLATDEGVQGDFEFPDPDAPVTVNGEVVVARFDVTGGVDFVLPASGASVSRRVLALGALALGIGLVSLAIVSRGLASRNVPT